MKKIKEIGKGIQGTPAPAKKENADNANASNISDAIKKNAANLTKDKVDANKSIYKGTDGLTLEDKKKFRSKIRRGLGKFVNAIFGKDRSEEERKESVAAFMKFYKENWKVQDFKIESFTQSKDEVDLKDYKNLLKFIQDAKGK